jgi:hypothetical protein
VLVSIFYTGGISNSEKGRDLRKNERDQIISQYFSVALTKNTLFRRIAFLRRIFSMNYDHFIAKTFIK